MRIPVERTPAEVETEMRSLISEICTTIGPRPPCSQQKRACGLVLKQKLQDLCDEVTIERFVTHPHAYKAGFRLPMILYLSALFFYWIRPWVSLILAGTSFFVFFGEMALVYEVIDMIGNKGSPLELDSSEVFGLVKMDPAFTALVQDAAKQAGLILAAKPSMAFTDALSFRRKKVPAVALFSMPHGSKNFFYHTRYDTIENMRFENLASAYKICLNLVAKLDKM